MTTEAATDLSSGGATLQGSWSGATGEFESMGFKYGTNQSSLTSDLTAPLGYGASGSFSAQLSGKSPNTTYYYKAYVREYNASAQQYEYRYGSVVSFKTKAVATATVTTSSATNISSAGATLQGSYSGATGTVTDRGFYWGTSSASIQNPTTSTPTVALGSGSSSGSFSGSLSSLSTSTTYYYRAFVVEYDEAQSKYVDRLGSIQYFTTLAEGQVSRGYLDCYEVPAVSASGTGSSGEETYGSTKWRLWSTSTSTQKVVTHTFQQNGKVIRNYTAMLDKNKKAPLWSAFVMHADVFPDDNVGRSGSWNPDPAFGDDWQQSSSDSNYSRGHFVASNYRQNKNNGSTSDSNKQTFYYTNQALQWQDSFNSGVWSNLEQAVAGHATTGRDTLYVVVGTLYESSKTSNGVPVPSHFYKLLMKCSFNSAGEMTAASGCAYIFTNEAHSGESYTDSKFRTTIDAIEQRTGIDFFHNVPDNFENTAEQSSTPLW